MATDKKLIDQLLTEYKTPEDIIGEIGLLKELTKAILEHALEAEMTEYLGYAKHDPPGHHRANTRNGKPPKRERRFRRAETGDTARSAGNIPVQDRGQGTDALGGLR